MERLLDWELGALMSNYSAEAVYAQRVDGPRAARWTWSRACDLWAIVTRIVERRLARHRPRALAW